MIALIIVISVLVLWFFFGYFCFYLGCKSHRQEEKDGPAGGSNIPSNAKKALAESKAWSDTIPHEKVIIRSLDGLSLYGRLITAENPKGTVIFAHGYHSSCRRDLVIQARAVYNDGYNVLLVTHRAHGESEGRYITFGVKESDDLILWAEFIESRYPSLPIALMGLSMGGATVMYTADKKLPDEVKCLINDCGFTSPWAISANTLLYKRFILPFPTTFFMDIWSRILAKFSFFTTSSFRSLKKNTRPLLIIHGDLDRFVPTKMSMKSAKIDKERTELMIVQGAKHAQAVYFDMDGYISKLLSFLNTNMTLRS